MSDRIAELERQLTDIRDLPALNSAVAKVLGLSRCKTNWPVAVWEDADCTSKYQGDIALDWNALMAAVKVLEKKHYFFDRDSGDGAWRVDKRGWSVTFYFGFDGSGNVSERDALARCIHAVVQEEG